MCTPDFGIASTEPIPASNYYSKDSHDTGSSRYATHIFNSNDVVTFDFSDSKNTHIIELPEKIIWWTFRHTHLTEEICLQIETLSGFWFIGSAQWGRPAPAPPEQTEIFKAFGRMGPPTDVARARFTCSKKARQLEHVLVSVVQDAKLYFWLCSTPIWVHHLYELLSRLGNDT